MLPDARRTATSGRRLQSRYSPPLDPELSACSDRQAAECWDHSAGAGADAGGARVLDPDTLRHVREALSRGKPGMAA